MKVSENFTIQEFVPKEVYQKWGNNSIWFIDPVIIQVAQALRDEFGPVIINGGSYNYSGFRPADCSVGAKLSQHRFGRAIDCKFKNITPQKAYTEILVNQKHWMESGITTMENIAKTTSWLHVDCRTTNMNEILIVNP